MAEFHTLSVSDIKNETPNCVSVYFDIPEDLQEEFLYTAGQYLTLKTTINEEEVRRAYSIFTAPFEKEIGVTVKQIADGKMSTFLNNHLKVGDTIEVMKPEGKFVIKPKVDQQRDHYFFTAGSGITPVLSMIKTVLEEEPKSAVYLLYGSRDEDNIIFHKELDRLQENYQDQLILDITLSQPSKEKSKGLMGVLGKKSSSWKGQKGRISSKKVAQFLQMNSPRSNDHFYYLCGPGEMISDISTILLGNGAKKEEIYQEYFSSAPKEAEAVSGSKEATLIAILDNTEIKIEVPEGKTLLAALLDEGHDAPYSCTSGACSSCMAKVIEGSAEMELCYALDDDEVKDGYILTCQAHATSKSIKIEY